MMGLPTAGSITVGKRRTVAAASQPGLQQNTDSGRRPARPPGWGRARLARPDTGRVFQLFKLKKYDEGAEALTTVTQERGFDYPSG